MTNLDKELSIFQQLFGLQLGNILGIFIVVVFIYNYVLKSGIVQHIFTAFNFRLWKTKKEIERITELLSNAELSETIKKNLNFRILLLQLQQSFKTKETNIAILEFLSGFHNLPSAIKKYERSKSKLIYVPHTQSFSLNPDYSFNTDYTTAKRRNFWIPILYWVLTLPAAFCVIYLHNLKYLDSIFVGSYYFVPIPLLIFASWVFLIAFYLRHLLEKANAVELLHMDRID